MKHYLLALPFLFLVLFSCEQLEGKENEDVTPYESESLISPDEKTAVCLLDNIVLYEEPNENSKHMTTIFFGERMEAKGKPEESNGKSWIKLKLTDGAKGYVLSETIATKAELGAIIDGSTIYKRPELTTMTTQMFNRGELVAIVEKEGGFYKAIGYGGQKQGWVNGEKAVSQDLADVNTALIMFKSDNEIDASKKKMLLQSVLDNPNLSVTTFTNDVKGMISEAAKREETMGSLSENQFYTNATRVNVRNQPNTASSSVVFQLSQGDVGDILEKGSSETISGKTDNWYKIKYNGQSGWVFGSFIKMGAK